MPSVQNTIDTDVSVANSAIEIAPKLVASVNTTGFDLTQISYFSESSNDKVVSVTKEIVNSSPLNVSASPAGGIAPQPCSLRSESPSNLDQISYFSSESSNDTKVVSVTKEIANSSPLNVSASPAGGVAPQPCSLRSESPSNLDQISYSSESLTLPGITKLPSSLF